MSELGRKINGIARDFNSGYGTVRQLRRVCQLQAEIYERLHALRMMGFPMRDNSKSISVRMMEEQYRRLLQYLPRTRLHSATYFRKLIAEVYLVCRPPKGDMNPRPASNKIYSESQGDG
ncbi:MAG: hypothetical protein KH420_04640 [Clostridiales bacterium]|nr:hypothetical protein [Clostridiales bacterium]